MQSRSGPFLLTPLCEVELANALQLRVFRKQIPAEAAARAYHDFEFDVAAGTVLSRSMQTAAFARARQLAQRYTAELGVRALDILHVAAALIMNVDEIATFDQAVRKLATAAGLTAVPE